MEVINAMILDNTDAYQWQVNHLDVSRVGDEPGMLAVSLRGVTPGTGSPPTCVFRVSEEKLRGFLRTVLADLVEVGSLVEVPPMSPIMKVADIDRSTGYALCEWFDGHIVRRDTWALASLQPVPPDDPKCTGEFNAEIF